MSVVLLTGGTGFLGRQIHKALNAAGHSVRLVIRPTARTRIMPLMSTVEAIESEDMFAQSPEWWADVCKDTDAVIHAAWYVEPGLYLNSKENYNCVVGTLNLSQGAIAAGVKHFIGIGTCFEYKLPAKNLSVESELEPRNVYSSAKLSTFFMLREMLRNSDARFSWGRVFYLYGEGERPERLAPYIRRQLEKGEVARLSAGTQLRDFLDVAEAGEMIAGIVDTGQPGAINICSGVPVTVRQFAERIADAYGRRDLLEFDPARGHPDDPSAVVGVCNVIPSTRVPETDHEGAAEASY